MTAPRKLDVVLTVVFLLVGGFLCPALFAQEKCSAEEKLQLSPEQIRLAATQLGARGETAGHVYLFDTDKLDLFSQGIVVRLRQGTSNDLMVKLRPPAGKRFFDPGEKGSKYKCEMDWSAGHAQPSYSITSPYAGEQPPKKGSEVLDLLTPAQKKLIQEARVSVDWSRVHRIAEIQSTQWQITDQGGFRKLTLELWKWPSGQILELSTKTPAGRAATAYTALQQLVRAKGLAPTDNQRLKTTVVLQSVTSK